MNKDEYREKMKMLYKDFDKAKKAIMTEYAESNSTVQIGDIFEDHIGLIRVEKMFLHHYEKSPSLIYYGTKVKKNGGFFKAREKRRALQMNGIR